MSPIGGISEPHQACDTEIARLREENERLESRLVTEINTSIGYRHLYEQAESRLAQVREALEELVAWAETVTFISDRGIAAIGIAKANLRALEEST